jgi:hypothetical protein
VGIGELGVDRSQFGHGLFQLAGAIAHELFEGDRPLEHREGRMRQVGRAFDAVDQRGVDLAQLGVLVFQPREGIGVLRGRAGSGKPGAGWPVIARWPAR